MTATPTTFTAADANFDGYADIYQLVPAGNASTLNVNLLSGSATATSMPVTLTPGTQPISAVWAGNQNFNGATASGTVVVEGAVTAAATTTTLTSALNPAPLGTPVPLTAVVTPAAISTLLPSGTVTFFDGTNRLGAATLDLTGTATYSATTLASGTHALSAVYNGRCQLPGLHLRRRERAGHGRATQCGPHRAAEFPAGPAADPELPAGEPLSHAAERDV